MIPPEAWAELLRAGHPMRFARGARLMSQGDPADHVQLLIDGRVKVWRDEPEGKKIVLAVRWPGELLGERGLFGDTRRTASVAAIDPCRTVRIRADRFDRLVRGLRLENVVLQYFISRLEEGERFRADLMVPSAVWRIARCLVKLADTALRHQPAATEIDVGLARADLASVVGVTRQTVHAVMKKLQDDGVVTVRNRRIVVLDLPELRNRTGFQSP